MMWLWVLSLLPIKLAISDHIFTSKFKVFPANHRIAGVFQVSSTNYLNQPQYAFNASVARRVCQSLGVTMASKDQVQEALIQGLETCRFGWIDENFLVIPRIEASITCGKNNTGLVPWRASVTQKSDVFCYDQSDMVTQLKDTTADSLLTTRDHQERTHSPSETSTSTFEPQPTFTTHLFKSTHSTLSPSPSLSSPLSLSTSSSLHPSPSSLETEVELSQSMSSTQASIGAPAKALLITSTCALLLLAIAILSYFKLNTSRCLSWDVKQQEEYIETEEWTCVKTVKEPQNEEAQEEVKKEADNNVKVNITEKEALGPD